MQGNVNTGFIEKYGSAILRELRLPSAIKFMKKRETEDSVAVYALRYPQINPLIHITSTTLSNILQPEDSGRYSYKDVAVSIRALVFHATSMDYLHINKDQLPSNPSLARVVLTADYCNTMSGTYLFERNAVHMAVANQSKEWLALRYQEAHPKDALDEAYTEFVANLVKPFDACHHVQNPQGERTIVSLFEGMTF